MVLHHISLRKRIHQKKEKYPHPNKWVNLLDKIILVLAVIGPLMVLPQVIKIFINKSSGDLSLFTWLSAFIFAIFWLTYGFMHKEKPIIIANTLAIIINFLIVIGIWMY